MRHYNIDAPSSPLGKGWAGQMGRRMLHEARRRRAGPRRWPQDTDCGKPEARNGPTMHTLHIQLALPNWPWRRVAGEALLLAWRCRAMTGAGVAPSRPRRAGQLGRRMLHEARRRGAGPGRWSQDTSCGKLQAWNGPTHNAYTPHLQLATTAFPAWPCRAMAGAALLPSVPRQRCASTPLIGPTALCWGAAGESGAPQMLAGECGRHQQKEAHTPAGAAHTSASSLRGRSGDVLADALAACGVCRAWNVGERGSGGGRKGDKTGSRGVRRKTKTQARSACGALSCSPPFGLPPSVPLAQHCSLAGPWLCAGAACGRGKAGPRPRQGKVNAAAGEVD